MIFKLYELGKRASKQASKQAGKQASKRAHRQASGRQAGSAQAFTACPVSATKGQRPGPTRPGSKLIQKKSK